MADIASFSGRSPTVGDINILALVKDGERYVFIFTDEYKPDILRTFGRFASHPELSFTWYDAAKMSQKTRGESKDF